MPPPGTGDGADVAPSDSASTSEKRAGAKLRSCVVCRSRKVRCDKLSPCTNCRRANVQCVVPSTDRPPRWARRLERITNGAAVAPPSASTNEAPPQQGDPGVGQVMDRLRNLESLVKELSGQLNQVNASTSSTGSSPPGAERAERAEYQASPASGTSGADMQKHFGRMVLQDANRSRYVSSGFWSRVSDELDGLKMDTRGLADDDSDTSDEESQEKTPSSQELDRAPSDRHAFLFGHNLGGSNMRDYRPLPSQIPFLLEIYVENINFFAQLVHMPTVTKLVRRGTDMSNLAPADEALLFSMFYAAIASMEEDDVVTNFGSPKSELVLKYRLGLEHAFARADFLNVPTLTLVQAFSNFLYLARRHDSPRFVWMMTGLLIRMAQALGLHRDGARFDNLSPFDAEMRRRAWWLICLLDIRASEDQGTDFTIPSGSFDTKLPLNIDNADMNPESKELPPERQGLTDMSIALVMFQMCESNRKMMAPGATGGGPTIDEQSQLLNNLYEKLERGYLQYATASGNIAYWVIVRVTRLLISKLTLFIYLPALFSSPSETFSEEIRNRLLVAAIEVAEWNHALNAETAARQWRWIYQTYTHWHAIAYLLIESSRRPWSPVVERAWVALHSVWLIPAQPNLDKNLRIWLPLRKMMTKARRHRDAELKRLRGDPSAAEQLVADDRNIPTPASEGPFAGGNSEEVFREHWRRLITESAVEHPPQDFDTSAANPSIVVQQQADFDPAFGQNAWPTPGFDSSSGHGFPNLGSTMPTDPQSEIVPEVSSAFPAEWEGGQYGPGTAPWLWADSTVDMFGNAGINMDVDTDSDINWNNWLQSATNMELNAEQPGGSGVPPMP